MSTASLLERVDPRLRDDESFFEIIDGQRMEIPPMSAFACLLANHLARELNFHARPLNVGQAVVEILFHLALPVDRNRRPDVAFVSFENWPKGQPLDPLANAWDVVPNLVIEVVSPHDLASELIEKLGEYFEAGVQLVWVVYPQQASVYVFESLTQVRGLTRNDTLDGGKVLPHFQMQLKGLFTE
jgi:Uma2 family endonuclease